MKAGTQIVLMTNSGEQGDGAKWRHIPGVPKSTYQTLCGWCDCIGQEEHQIADKGEPDCPMCIKALNHALTYRRFA